MNTFPETSRGAFEVLFHEVEDNGRFHSHRHRRRCHSLFSPDRATNPKLHEAQLESDVNSGGCSFPVQL